MFGCITDYEHKGIQSIEDIFVVEGTITNDTTLIKLSKTVGIENYFMGDEYITNAMVSVENDKGNSFAGIHVSKGEYLIENGDLQEGTPYRLRIAWEGEEYVSTYLTPVFTPEIDSISVLKKEKGAPVEICVSTHEPHNQSRYFRWKYKEHWEVHASLMATVGYERIDGKEEFVTYDLFSSNNKYYCWGVDSSKVLILDSSEKLSENRIAQKRIIEMEPSDDRLSELYYIKISQEMLRKEAFDYFFNLQKNMDGTGGLFSQMPSEMKGNITCTTNPEKTVIGYIEVATTTTMERYISSAEVYERPYDYCFNASTEDPNSGLVLYQQDLSGTFYAPNACIDCRTKSKASKNKPDFWPTNKL